EANAAFMAEGYGRLTGRPGVCIVTAGPGAVNSAAGVAQALVSNSPLVHISGTVPSGSRGEVTHTMFDPRALARLFEPITKRSIYVNN
ncbi:MAG: acetolactate synthase AlsS, partial [Gemmatimonadales bacterium]|nr:acetolactate synthase AlsS [Gemmatimonadales bacterium]